MKKLILAIASMSASTVLLGGAALAAPSISMTGPHSRNNITVFNVNTCMSKNNNNVGVLNLVTQRAKTGNAKVYHNTKGGSATTGDATNTADNSTSVDLSNSSACGTAPHSASSTNSSIDTTGPRSNNMINIINATSLKVVNNNNIDVSNVVFQGASSGNATVSGNTKGGDATTGSASNSSTNMTEITISNN